MEEYNGTIELISGLRTKNNGKYPLMRAEDVLMPDGSRLSDMNATWSVPNTFWGDFRHSDPTNPVIRKVVALLPMPIMLDGNAANRFDTIGIQTTEGSTASVQFALYQLVANEDGVTGTLKHVVTLGEATPYKGAATLILDEPYTCELDNIMPMVFSNEESLVASTLAGLTSTGPVYFDDGDFTVGDDIACNIASGTDAANVHLGYGYLAGAVIKREPLANFTLFMSSEIERLAHKVFTYPIVDIATTDIEMMFNTYYVIEPETYYVFGEVDSLKVTLSGTSKTNVHEYTFEFIPTENFTGIEFGSDAPKWVNEPQFPAGKVCQVSIMRGIGVMVCAET